jgi:hypothetical protein
VNSTFSRPRTDRASKKRAKLKGLPSAMNTPSATTIAAMEAADRGEVDRTSAAELARLWEIAANSGF